MSGHWTGLLHGLARTAPAELARDKPSNTRDFVGAEQSGIRIVTPREFLQLIGELP